jgi:hypothetical protein
MSRSDMPTAEERRGTLRKLHDSGFFIISNVWTRAARFA